MVLTTVEEALLGTFPALRIRCGPNEVLISLRGATLLSWTFEGTDLIDGYSSPEELTDQDSLRSAVMMPFSNRIRGNRYRYRQKEISFDEEGPGGRDVVLHGITRNSDFTVEGILRETDKVSVLFATTALQNQRGVGYPYSVRAEVEYTITPDGVGLITSGSNDGLEVAPFGMGWHPYFSLGVSNVSALELMTSATHRVLTDSSLIPVEGAAAIIPVEGLMDFRAFRPLEAVELDTCFVGLESGPDGLFHTFVRNSEAGLMLDVWQERGFVHIYTGGTSANPRGSLAVEPVEALTNAFNRSDQENAIALRPGETRSFRFGARLEKEKR